MTNVLLPGPRGPLSDAIVIAGPGRSVMDVRVIAPAGPPASQTDQTDGRMISLKARSVSEQRAVPAGGKRLTLAAAI